MLTQVRREACFAFFYKNGIFGRGDLLSIKLLCGTYNTYVRTNAQTYIPIFTRMSKIQERGRETSHKKVSRINCSLAHSIPFSPPPTLLRVHTHTYTQCLHCTCTHTSAITHRHHTITTRLQEWQLTNCETINQIKKLPTRQIHSHLAQLIKWSIQYYSNIKYTTHGTSSRRTVSPRHRRNNSKIKRTSINSVTIY